MCNTKSYRGGALLAAICMVGMTFSGAAPQRLACAAERFNAYADYGNAANNGPYCAATSIANSLQFLANENPGVYGSTSLIDGNAATTRDDIVGMETLEGGAGSPPTTNETIWDSKVQYINENAPGTTSFAAQISPIWGSTNLYANATDISNVIPTMDFLYSQLAAGEDVEISLTGAATLTANEEMDYSNSTSHMVTLTGINNATGDMSYLDPNSPGAFIDSLLTVDGNGYLSFYWNNGSNPGEQVEITQAWAESPITPIPSTAGLAAAGLIGLGSLALVRRARRQRQA